MAFMDVVQTLKSHLNQLFGDSNAVELCCSYFYVVQIWDDLIDRDVELVDNDIHQAFILALTKIPTNVFYLNNWTRVQPIISTMISKWLVANSYESKKEQLHKAYMLRAGFYDLLVICYIIQYGELVDCSPIYNLYGEIFSDYEKEILCQIQ